MYKVGSKHSVPFSPQLGYLCSPLGLYKDIPKFSWRANMRIIIHETKTGCHNWQHGNHSSMDSIHLINIYQEPRRSLADYEVPATPTLTVFCHLLRLQMVGNRPPPGEEMCS